MGCERGVGGVEQEAPGVGGELGARDTRRTLVWPKNLTGKGMEGKTLGDTKKTFNGGGWVGDGGRESSGL